MSKFDPTDPETWTDADWQAAYAFEATVVAPVLSVYVLSEAA